jgi:hypothetical protein
MYLIPIDKNDLGYFLLLLDLISVPDNTEQLELQFFDMSPGKSENDRQIQA